MFAESVLRCETGRNVVKIAKPQELEFQAASNLKCPQTMKKASSADVSLHQESEPCNKRQSMLLDSKDFIQLIPALAVAMGLDEAIIIQTLHFCENGPNSGRIINGKKWIFNTYEQWQKDYFPWWSVIHIKRLFLFLERIGVIMSCQPEGAFSRRKYYRLNEAVVRKMKMGEFSSEKRTRRISKKHPSYPEDTLNVSAGYVPITENSFREHNQRTLMTEAHASEALVFDAPIPKPVSKYEQLATISEPQGMPTESEFERFLEKSEEGQYVLKYRSDLYSQFCDHKWHEWDKKANKWTPIRDWKGYTLKLGEKIRNDMP